MGQDSRISASPSTDLGLSGTYKKGSMGSTSSCEGKGNERRTLFLFCAYKLWQGLRSVPEGRGTKHYIGTIEIDKTGKF